MKAALGIVGFALLACACGLAVFGRVRGVAWPIGLALAAMLLAVAVLGCASDLKGGPSA